MPSTTRLSPLEVATVAGFLVALALLSELYFVTMCVLGYVVSGL